MKIRALIILFKLTENFNDERKEATEGDLMEFSALRDANV